MKNKSVLKIFMLALLFISIFVAFKSADFDYTPLNNSTYNQPGDTIGSASTNDTGWTFTNSNKYNDVWIDYTQNGIRSTFKVAYPVFKFRTRYYATDSSLYVESSSDIGWIAVPLLPVGSQSTTVGKITATAKTGNWVIEPKAIKYN